MCSIPGLGKIPHVAEQLSPCAVTTEACVPRAHAPQQEKPPQIEKARAQQQESVQPQINK